MKVSVIKGWHSPESYVVQIKQGVQVFTLDYRATKAECQWMRKMFKFALAAHDKEQLDKQSKSKRHTTKKDLQNRSRKS